MSVMMIKLLSCQLLGDAEATVQSIPSWDSWCNLELMQGSVFDGNALASAAETD